MGEKQGARAAAITLSMDELAQSGLQEMVAEQVLDLLHEREALGQSLRDMIKAAAAKASKDYAPASSGSAARLRA